MHAKNMKNFHFVLRDSSTRLAKWKNQVEERTLEKQKKVIEKEERAIFRQLQALKKDRYSHEFYNSSPMSDPSVPDQYRRKRFIEVPVDLAQSNAKTENLLTASSVERTRTRLREQSICEDQDVGQIVKLSLTPKLEKKVYQEDKVPNNRSERRHTITNLSLPPGHFDVVYRRQCSTPDERMFSSGRQFRSRTCPINEPGQTERLRARTSSGKDCKHTSKQNWQKGGRQTPLITKCNESDDCSTDLSNTDSEHDDVFSNSPSPTNQTNENCVRRQSPNNLSRRVKSASHTHRASVKFNFLPSSPHSSKNSTWRRTVSVEKLPSSQLQRSKQVQTKTGIKTTSNLKGEQIVNPELDKTDNNCNTKITTKFNRLPSHPETAQVPSLSQHVKATAHRVKPQPQPRPKTSLGFRENATKQLLQIASKSRRTMKLEQALNRSLQSRTRPLNVTNFSCSEETIAKQTILRQMENKMSTSKARKLTRQHFAGAKLRKEILGERAPLTTDRNSASGAEKSNNISRTTETNDPAMKRVAKTILQTSKAARAWTSFKSQNTGKVNVALTNLSKGLEDCRYLRCSASPRDTCTEEKSNECTPRYAAAVNEPQPALLAEVEAEYKLLYLS